MSVDLSTKAFRAGQRDPFVMSLSDLEKHRELGETAKDREVRAVSNALAHERILLVITGSIAAERTPELVRRLRSFGAQVDVRMTKSAHSVVGKSALEWSALDGRVFDDVQLTGEVEHLDRYTTYLVVPATYNFVNSMAHGQANTPALTTMAAALGRVEQGKARILVSPCLNGDMNNGIFRESVDRLIRAGVEFIAPRFEDGKLKLPDLQTVAVAVARSCSQSVLKSVDVLVTGGPTPVPLDKVRLITNKFTGKLGTEIAKELVLRGANPVFLLGGNYHIPSYLEPFVTRHATYDEYKARVLEIARSDSKMELAVLSAAVADYRPETVFPGKIPSKQRSLRLPDFIPTEKVVDLLHDERPELPIVSFKLLSMVPEEELVDEAKHRLSTHSEMVVANLEEECTPERQVVRIVSKESVSRKEGSKREVAVAIVDAIEAFFEKRRDQ